MKRTKQKLHVKWVATGYWIDKNKIYHVQSMDNLSQTLYIPNSVRYHIDWTMDLRQSSKRMIKNKINSFFGRMMINIFDFKIEK